ncbi:porin [Suttonella sp. R2A3]|uniref:porin n=1 Tax=Suttonella sp. R2A3 TaxID=2908648 RepID=UPI001F3B20A8|nr:porin [Suttonella sp. R2A3]UJF24286.1 porin [Suttonella sp. R2A3]
MKKSLIALAVAAGSIAAVQADTTTLYGSLGYSISVADSTGEGKTAVDKLQENVWDLQTTTSKIGVKGTEDLGNGLQAFFKFEGTGALADSRYAYIGLKGDFGTVTIGRQDSVWKLATTYNDIFNDVYFKGHMGTGRVPKAISYVSPSMGGLNLAGAIILDGDASVIKTSDNKGVDAYQIGALYNNNGLFAGAAYHFQHGDASSPKATTEFVGLNIGYSNDTFKVGFGAEHQASADEYYNLAGEYYFGQNTLRAGIGYETNDDKDLEIALGYQYNLSQRTYAWVEGTYLKSDADAKDGNYKALVGIRHDF